MRDSNISGLLSQPVQIHYVLLHPDVGMALLDVAPAVTPDAEAILRQRLAAVRFEAIFQGYLPIVYRSIRPSDVNAIDGILAEAFAALPPLTLAGGDAWVTVMQRALSPRDPSRASAPSAPPGPRPAWQARPPAEPPSPPPEAAPAQDAAPEEEDTPSDPAEPEEMPWPANDAEPEPIQLAPLPPGPRRLRPGIWLAAGLGAALAISGLATVMSGGDRPAIPTEQATPPAPAATATAPQPESPPSQPAAAPVDTAGPAPVTPRNAGNAPSAETSARGEAAMPAAPAPASPAVAALPAAPPPPPAPPAPVRGGTAGAGVPPAPARPAAGSQAMADRVEVKSPANLRKGPANTYAVLRVTRRGETFRVFGHALGGWVEVGDDQPQGWIHSSLLAELTP